jgi:hypothetical protein
MKRIGIIALGFLVGCSGAGDSDEQLDAGAVTTQGADDSDLAEEGEGWRTLFDGQSLEGWVQRGDATWRVEGGSVTPASSGPGFLTTAESFADFQLRLEFWTDTIANGGVFLRIPVDGEITQFNSLEVNIFDASAEWPTGSVNQVHRHDPEPTTGRWASYDITAEGDRVVIVLDGDTTVDARVADRLPSGPKALQILGEGEIRYRNVRIFPR